MRQVLETRWRERMSLVGSELRVFSRSSGVARTCRTAQLGLVQVCCGAYCSDGCVVVCGGCDGLCLVMRVVSLGSGS